MNVVDYTFLDCGVPMSIPAPTKVERDLFGCNAIAAVTAYRERTAARFPMYGRCPLRWARQMFVALAEKSSCS